MGGCVRFSADGQDFTRAIALGSITSLTVAGWFKISADRNTWSTVWSLDNGTANNWCMQTSNDGTTMAMVADGNTSTTNMGSLTVGTWYYFCFVWTGSGSTLYYRAASSPTLTTSTPSVNTGSLNAATLRIGESPWGSEWLNGCVAAFKMWSGVQLSAAEALAESYQYAPVRVAGLTSFHPFVKTETTDYSGNGRTLSGGTGTATEDGPPLTWKGVPVRIIRPAAAGGGTPVSASDSATASDTSAVTAQASPTDSATVADSSGVQVSAAVTDAGTTTDTASLTANATVTDAGTTTDTASLTANDAVTDSGTITDTSSLTTAVSATDSATVTDISSLDAGGTPKPASDTSTVSEVSSVSVAASTTDAFTTADTAALSMSSSRTDSASFADLAFLAVNIAGGDGASLTEAASVVVFVSATDSAVLAESRTIDNGESPGDLQLTFGDAELGWQFANAELGWEFGEAETGWTFGKAET